MGISTQDLPALTIAAGTTISNMVSGFEDARTILITAPVTLTNTVQLHVHPDDAAAASLTTNSAHWATLTSGGSVITMIGFTAVELTDVAFRSLQIASQGTEAAVRTFRVTKKTVT